MIKNIRIEQLLFQSDYQNAYSKVIEIEEYLGIISNNN